MRKQNDYKQSNFWFGFALGSCIIGGAAFLFGTKKGRETLKKVIELTENFEETIIKLEEELKKEGIYLREELGKIPRSLSTGASTEQKKQSSMLNILDKIKILSPSNREGNKKFFLKENK